MGEEEGDDEERNSEEETLPLDSSFLSLNQNSLDKREKLCVGRINTNSDVSLHNPTEEPSSRIRGAICKAQREVKDPMNPNKWVTITDHLDSCGAFDLVQRQYLHDIKPVAQYCMHPIRMSCLDSGIGWSSKLLCKDHRPNASQPPVLVRRRSRHRQGHGRQCYYSIIPYHTIV